MYSERKFTEQKETLGNLDVDLKSERFPGHPLLDTEVNIGGENLCFISYPDKDDFIRELEEVIDKYRI